MRIVLAESQTIVREGIASLLRTMIPGIIIDMAETGTDAYACYAEHPADLLVTELLLPDFSGIELCRRLRVRWRRANVLFLSPVVEPVIVRQALDAGASGFVSRRCRPSELVTAIRTSSHGEVYLEHSLATRLALSQRGVSDVRLSEMTQRELEIMILVARGSSARDIAVCLNISSKTVSNHLALLKGKLGVSSAVELLHLAADAGLVSYGMGRGTTVGNTESAVQLS